ncbi:MAG: hypothetical protein ACXWZE_20360, partial [Candidatus Binatia bacterium]
ATEIRNISRKDAKAAKVTGDARLPEGIRGIEERFLPRVEMTTIPNLATLRLWESQFHVLVFPLPENLRKLRKPLGKAAQSKSQDEFRT